MLLPELVRMLPAEDWWALTAAIKQFEDAWRQGPRPRIDDFLPTGAPLRARVLNELSKTAELI
jgi:hypothetical protein